MKIDAKTTVPIFSILYSMPFVIVAVVAWAKTDAKATMALSKASAVKKISSQIQYSLIRIETKLGTLPEKNPFEEPLEE
jgi:hypothetical protein